MVNESREFSSRSLLLSIGALTACAFLWPAIFSFDWGDWPSPNRFPNNVPTANACGVVGAWIAYHLLYWLGDGIFPLMLFLTFVSIARLARGRVNGLIGKGFGLVLLIACTAATAHLISDPFTAPLPIGHGGVLGRSVGMALRGHLDRLGTMIVLTSSMIVGLIFATEGWVLKLPVFVRGVGRVSGRAVVSARQLAGQAAGRLRDESGVTTEESDLLLDEEDAEEESDDATLYDEAEQEQEEETEEVDEAEGEDESVEEESTRSAKDTARAPKRRRSKKQAKRPVVNYPKPETSRETYPKQIENWRLPSIDLLAEPEYGFSEQQEDYVRKQAQVLERTLEEFRLDARVVEIDTGPVITMFELRLGAGIKVSQIGSLSNDIARALKAHAVRVVAPISGKNTVGIEVPNITKEKVRIRELMTLAGGKASGMALPLFLGKDAGGAALVVDLSAMPHALVAGTTGSGKSVCLSAIILSLLMTKRPDHVKMILIDPKMVELNQFRVVPHLMCPIVTDMAKAEKILEWAVTKMDERYELLAEARVKNIAEYNKLGPKALYERLGATTEGEQSRVLTFMPYIVIVIDELADLMMTAAREVEHHLARLAQKSRAVGVHIIVATQRPEAKVVTGLIKSNLPTRVCFRVASRMDSRIVLDQNGGEVLLGQGDMLFLPPGSHKLVRAQGTFLEETEILSVLSDLESRAQPEFHPQLMRIKSPNASVPGELRDALFDEAVPLIIRSGRGSVSLLQRRLTIGYSRASRLVEQMADAGIVGDHKGSQAREVLMTMDEWGALQEQLDADLAAGYEADEECEPEEAEADEWEDEGERDDDPLAYEESDDESGRAVEGAGISD